MKLLNNGTAILESLNSYSQDTGFENTIPLRSMLEVYDDTVLNIREILKKYHVGAPHHTTREFDLSKYVINDVETSPLTPEKKSTHEPVSERPVRKEGKGKVKKTTTKHTVIPTKKPTESTEHPKTKKIVRKPVRTQPIKKQHTPPHDEMFDIDGSGGLATGMNPGTSPS
jgi:hypothetical protein